MPAARTDNTTTLDAFAAYYDLNTAALCAHIVARGQAAAGIRNTETATANLSRIVEAALRLANRKGFAAMTLRELAAASGLSLGGLYAYIRNKDSLAQLIQQQIGVTLRTVMTDTLTDLTDPRERLALAIRSHVFTTELLRDWFFFLYMEAHHLTSTARGEAIALERGSETVFCDIIRAGQTSGAYAGVPAPVAAGLLKAMLQDWYLKRMKHHARGLDALSYADTVTSAIEAYLTTPGIPEEIP